MTASPPSNNLRDRIGKYALIVLAAPFAILLLGAVLGIDVMSAKPFSVWFIGTLFFCAVWTTIDSFRTPHKSDWGCAIPLAAFTALLGYTLLGQLGWR